MNTSETKTMQRSFQALLVRTAGTACSLLLSILLARLLGADGSGIYFLSATIIGIASITARLGLDNTLLRFSSLYFEQGDWANLKGLYLKALGWSSLASILISFLIFALSKTIGLSVFQEPDLVLPLQIMSISILPLSLLNLHAELLKSAKKVKTALFIQSVAVPIMAIFILVILAKSLAVVGAAIASAVACTLIMLLSIYFWRKTFIHLPDTKHLTFSNKQLFASSLPLYTVAIMNIIIDFSDTVLIGFFLTSASVGIYTVALRITALNSLILSAVNSVVAADFSQLWANQKKAELTSLAQKSTRLMAAAAFIILVLCLTFADTILNLFGGEFILGYNAFIVLAIGQFIALATGPVAYLLMMTGHEKFHRNNVVFSAVLNIILNCLLIPVFEIEGAAIATAISLTTKNIIALLFVRQKLGIKVLV